MVNGSKTELEVAETQTGMNNNRLPLPREEVAIYLMQEILIRNNA
jgi:hypothetical protein